MATFESYARYYDRFYPQAKFEEEAAFVHGLLTEFGCAPGPLLDLGCGTGRHDECLARLGWRVCGADRSEAMLARARARGVPGAEFHRADIRSLALDRRFPAAVSLFHVMSYMIEAPDLALACAAAARHLEPDGLFLFDYWYAPAVAAQGTEVRTRRLEIPEAEGGPEGALVLERRATPEVLGPDRIDVVYDLTAATPEGRVLDRTREVHPMRAWTPEAVRTALAAAGLNPVIEGGWLGRSAPTEADWGAYVLARRSR